MRQAYIITDESRIEGQIEFMTHDEYLSALDELEARGLGYIDIQPL